jgi:hypothetical protein
MKGRENMPRLTLNQEIFRDPDRVGQAEYRAVYEIVDDAIGTPDVSEEEEKEETEKLIKMILQEFITIAGDLLKSLEKNPATKEEE